MYKKIKDSLNLDAIEGRLEREEESCEMCGDVLNPLVRVCMECHWEANAIALWQAVKERRRLRRVDGLALIGEVRRLREVEQRSRALCEAVAKARHVIAGDFPELIDYGEWRDIDEILEKVANREPGINPVGFTTEDVALSRKNDSH